MFTKLCKQLNPYHLFASLIIAAAGIFRIVLASLGWPLNNSDEAIYNLMAYNIWKYAERPTFMYGGNYLGPLEEYIGAVLFRIFGPSAFVMHIEMVGLFMLFLLGLYLLTYRLYTPPFALVSIAFLAPGTELMLRRQIQATGGNSEINVFGVFLLLISFTLAAGRVEKGRQRALLYCLWGLLAGLALWSHILIAPYLLAAALLLVIFCWREMLKWGLWLLLPGFVVGDFPLIYYNITAPPGANSWETFLRLSSMGAPTHDNFWTHITRATLVSLPIMSGNRLAIFIASWPSKIPHALRYATLQNAWSIGYCLLLLCSVGFTIVALIRMRRDHPARVIWAQNVARLLLGCVAILTLVLYVKGSATVLDDYNGARYLSILWISMPVVLWPLWRGLCYIRGFPLWFNACKMSFCAVVWVGVALTLLFSTMYTVQQIPVVQAKAQQLTRLITTLERLHVTRFYSEYWTCYRVIFVSRESMICANSVVVNGRLVHVDDRYMRYQALLKATPNPAYVYPEYDDRPIQLVRQLAAQQHIAYQRVDVAGYAIFVPARPLQHTGL